MNAIKLWLVNFNESMPRLWKTALLTVAAIVFLAVASVDQFGVLYKKCVLVAVAAVVGYYIDRAVFPYARPHDVKSLADDQRTLWRKQTIDVSDFQVAYVAALESAFGNACIRRAIIIAATLLAFALGA